MNNLQIFDNQQFGKIRVVEVDAAPYFVGRDVATALGYQRPNDAISQHVDNEDTVKYRISDNQGIPHESLLINESGVYSLVFGSKLESAKAFKRWVTTEVLPCIRKHGAYLSDQKVEEVLTDPDTLIKLATQLKFERAERQRLAELTELHCQQLQQAAPKVQYFDAVLMSGDTYNTNQIAKELGMSGVTLNRKLCNLKVQYRQGGQWLLFAKYQNRGYTKTHTHTFTHSDGSHGTSMQTVWTEAGRKFIHELLR